MWLQRRHRCRAPPHSPPPLPEALTRRGHGGGGNDCPWTSTSANSYHHSQSVVECDAEFGSLAFFGTRLRFGHVSHNLRSPSDKHFAAGRLHILCDLGHDLVACLCFFGVDGLGQLNRNHASRSDSGRLARGTLRLLCRPVGGGRWWSRIGRGRYCVLSTPVPHSNAAMIAEITIAETVRKAFIVFSFTLV